jgi:hypothetical protein
MKIINTIRNCAIYFEKKKNALFSYSIEKQKAYLSSFSHPSNDNDRSFYQYKCQMKVYGLLYETMINLVSLILSMIFLLKIKNKVTIVDFENFDAVSILDGKPANILPDEITNEFTNIKHHNSEPRKLNLNRDDREFIMKIWRQYPFSWHFILKILIKVAMYSYFINIYKPKAIIVCAEYSFTSSILTAYCEKNSIEHINVMHGEKLFYIRDSFFRFHKCYIWDEYYKDLFIKLRAEPDQFIISLPESMRFSNANEKKKQIGYTYYLANESEDELNKILKLLRKLTENGFKIAVRPHPRYSDMDKINYLFNGFVIENSQELTIEESLIRTKNAISLYSTVLNQAYHNGVNIIIDDLSNPNHFEKLSELKYINLNRKHTLLSEIITKER